MRSTAEACVPALLDPSLGSGCEGTSQAPQSRVAVGWSDLFRSLGLPFIQECRAFLSRPREADVLMSLLLKPCDHVSDLRRIDNVQNLTIRSVGEDGNKHQHCLLPVQDVGATTELTH